MEMKNSFKKTAIFGLIAILLLSVVIHWPFSNFPPINPDDCTNASQAILIAKLGYIPYLLHPIFSFMGFYPASDTSGIMIAESALYCVIPVPHMITTNTLFSLIVSAMFVMATYITARKFIKHPLCQFIPPIALILPQYIMRDSQWVAVGSRALALLFLVLFFFVTYQIFTVRKVEKAKYFVLAFLFGIGGSCSHLTFLYYLPFVTVPFIVFLFGKKVLTIVMKITPMLKLRLSKWSRYLFIVVVAILYFLPFYGFSIFPYAKTLPQLMTFQVIEIGQNVYVAFVWTYIMYYGILFGLGIFGILVICLDKISRTNQILLIAILFFSQVYVDLTYFIIVFSLFLALFAGIGVEYLLKKKNKFTVLVFFFAILPCAIVGVVYVYRYQYFELGLFTILILIFVGVLYYWFRGALRMEKLKTPIALFIIYLVILAPAFSICSYNYDYSGRLKNRIIFNPVMRSDESTISNALYLKYRDTGEGLLLNHAPYSGTTAVIAEKNTLNNFASLMYIQEFKKGAHISSVEWSISKPKTFFTGTCQIGNRTFDLDYHYDWGIFQSNFEEGRKLAHAAGAYYISEYIPCEGKFYHTFPPYKFFDSYLLKQKNNYAYCIYQNSFYRTYYF
ncbi:MAG: hypothetical protein ACP5LE_04975 [Thermoplasmata archaeon]